MMTADWTVSLEKKMAVIFRWRMLKLGRILGVVRRFQHIQARTRFSWRDDTHK